MAPVNIIIEVRDIFLRLMSANIGCHILPQWMKPSGTVADHISGKLIRPSLLIQLKQKVAAKAIFFEVDVKRLSGRKFSRQVKSIPQIIFAPAFLVRFDLAFDDFGKRPYQNIACFHFH
jgi:hypothetical protein